MASLILLRFLAEGHYGANVGATAVYLVQQQLLPLARTCEVMRDLLGVQMSEGTVCDLITRCAGQLAPVEQQITEALQRAEVIHQDETGLYVAGKRHWMPVTCTPTLTHYHVDTSRGQAALEAIGILPQFTGISVHDGWGSYFLYNCEHAVCIVHRLARPRISRRARNPLGCRPQNPPVG
jgi:transposase